MFPLLAVGLLCGITTSSASTSVKIDIGDLNSKQEQSFPADINSLEYNKPRSDYWWDRPNSPFHQAHGSSHNVPVSQTVNFNNPFLTPDLFGPQAHGKPVESPHGFLGVQNQNQNDRSDSGIPFTGHTIDPVITPMDGTLQSPLHIEIVYTRDKMLKSLTLLNRNEQSVNSVVRTTIANDGVWGKKFHNNDFESAYGTVHLEHFRKYWNLDLEFQIDFKYDTQRNSRDYRSSGANYMGNKYTRERRGEEYRSGDKSNRENVINHEISVELHPRHVTLIDKDLLQDLMKKAVADHLKGIGGNFTSDYSSESKGKDMLVRVIRDTVSIPLKSSIRAID